MLRSHLAAKHARLQLAERPGRYSAQVNAYGEIQRSSHRPSADYSLHSPLEQRFRSRTAYCFHRDLWAIRPCFWLVWSVCWKLKEYFTHKWKHAENVLTLRSSEIVSSSGLEKCVSAMEVNGCRQNESLIKTSQHSSPSVNIWRRQKLKHTIIKTFLIKYESIITLPSVIKCFSCCLSHQNPDTY